MACKRGAALTILTVIISTTSAIAAPRGDADGDGKLSLIEYQTLNRTRLMRADKDGNGNISLEEWTARRTATKAKGDPAKAFQRFDANGDGGIDAAEIDPVLKQRFDRLDKDGDGILSEEELLARKAAAQNTGVGNGGGQDN